MSTSAEREASRPINRPPRVEMIEGRKGSVVIERHQKQGANCVQGRLVDLSRGGVKIAIDCCIPFDEKITLTVDFPEIHVEFRVLADVLWSRQTDNDRWLIGCSFEPGLPNETVDQLANEGYLERRCSPRYPISCDGTVRWELSDKSVPVRVADFSAEGFCLVTPSVAKMVGQRVQLELEGNDGDPVQIAARMCWHSTVEDGYLVGAEFLNPNDSHRLWEIAYQTTPNHPLRLRVPLTPSRWMIAWFAALIAVIIAYPPLVRLLTQHDSIAAEWSSNAAAVATDRHLEASTRPAAASQAPTQVTGESPADQPAAHPPADNVVVTSREAQAAARRDAARRETALAAASASPAPSAVATTLERTQDHGREQKKSWQADHQRRQAKLDKQGRELADQAVQLTRREVALQEEQTEWAHRLQRRQRDLDSQRRALLAAQAAWTNRQRERIETDRTAALAQALLDATVSAAPGTETPANQAPQTTATPFAEPQPTATAAASPPSTDPADRLAATPAAPSQPAATDELVPATSQLVTPTDSVPVNPASAPATPSNPPVTPKIAAQPATPQDPVAPHAVPPDLAPPIEPADRVTSNATATPLDVAADASQQPSRPPATITPIADDKAARTALRRGRRQLEAGQYAEAVGALQEAVQYQPENPLGYYLLALAQFQSGNQDAAEQSIRTGATVERQFPIANWGRTMQRCQGRPRLWLEQTRRKAKKNL